MHFSCHYRQKSRFLHFFSASYKKDYKLGKILVSIHKSQDLKLSHHHLFQAEEPESFFILIVWGTGI